MQYLMIENPGVAPTEGYILFGATTKRHSDDSRIIGTFGSGNKHGVALALRNSIPPTIFCGNQKMSFYTKPVTIKGVGGETTCQRICVKFGGKDITGKNTSSDKELDQTLEYGAKDWVDVSFALREFVSNAIDACYEQDLDHRMVDVSLVEENQVRAKAGYTRIFVPANYDVVEFYKNLGKWFLHFSEPELLKAAVLPKKDRNLGDKKNAVIYRRGVRIREFANTDLPSMFDYNLPDLTLNESRDSSDWDCKYYAGTAFKDTSLENTVEFIKSYVEGNKFWEHTFDEYSLSINYDSKEKIKVVSEKWQKALILAAGENACFSSSVVRDIVSGKGYKPVSFPESMHNFIVKLDVTSFIKILGEDDINGITIIPPTKAVINCVDDLWAKIDLVGLNYNKPKPVSNCFTKKTEAGSMVLGYYKNSQIYINSDISEAVTDQLRDCVIEELAHYITGALDGSRDFANWLIRFAVEMSKAI
jgi:hypothetical protein